MPQNRWAFTPMLRSTLLCRLVPCRSLLFVLEHKSPYTYVLLQKLLHISARTQKIQHVSILTQWLPYVLVLIQNVTFNVVLAQGSHTFRHQPEAFHNLWRPAVGGTAGRPLDFLISQDNNKSVRNHPEPSVLSLKASRRPEEAFSTFSWARAGRV